MIKVFLVLIVMPLSGEPKPLEIVFHVIKDPGLYGLYDCVDENHIICVSSSNVGHNQTLMRTMAHEMCHLKQCIRGQETDHDKQFKALAAAVCDANGFDPVEF